MSKYNSEVKESALRLLARRDYSSYELKQRLIKKGYEKSVVDEIVLILAEAGLQSDERFADTYVRRRMAKGFGPQHISSELIKLRVTDELIQQSIHKYEEEWQAVIKHLYYKKFRGSNSAANLKQQAKEIRFFQSRGFELTQIKAALIANENEEKSQSLISRD